MRTPRLYLERRKAWIRMGIALFGASQHSTASRNEIRAVSIFAFSNYSINPYHDVVRACMSVIGCSRAKCECLPRGTLKRLAFWLLLLSLFIRSSCGSILGFGSPLVNGFHAGVPYFDIAEGRFAGGALTARGGSDVRNYWSDATHVVPEGDRWRTPQPTPSTNPNPLSKYGILQPLRCMKARSPVIVEAPMR
jgi:hypothetical protein